MTVISTAHAACWYLIHTKPAREGIAEANLQRQGYEVYCPRVVQTGRMRGRWSDRVTSLFPRYLFLHLEAGHQAMGPVQSTLGVSGIVRFGTTYAIVPDQVIEGLRDRADVETGLHRLHQPEYEPGSKVRIVAGAFDGLEGVFQRKCGSDRVLVLLRLLGSETPVHVPVAFVEPQVRRYLFGAL